MPIDATVISFSSVIGGLLFMFGALYKHVSQRSKHPCSDNLVFEKTCAERGKSNEQCHEHIWRDMKADRKRSDERHAELKGDMNRQFEEVKSLIRQG